MSEPGLRHDPARPSQHRPARITVESMTLDDIPRVLEIDRLSFPLPWSTASYRYELTQNKNSHFFVALAPTAVPAAETRPGCLAAAVDRLGLAAWFTTQRPARHVVGYSGFWYIIDEAHISTIAVHPEWRSRGVGERLFVSMLERALDLGAVMITLEVRVSNEVAQALYRKYGFEVVGRRKRYYRDNGEDALLMTAELKPGYRDIVRAIFSGEHKGSGD